MTKDATMRHRFGKEVICIVLARQWPDKRRDEMWQKI